MFHFVTTLIIPLFHISATENTVFYFFYIIDEHATIKVATMHNKNNPFQTAEIVYLYKTTHHKITENTTKQP